MTKQEYDALPVREKDALVAMEVMEYTNVRPYLDTIVGEHPDHPGEDNWNVDHFTTAIAAAWTVVEKMREEGEANKCFGCLTCLELHGADRSDYDGLHWTVVIWGEEAEAPTAEAAICEAALRAKGVITDANGGNP